MDGHGMYRTTSLDLSAALRTTLGKAPSCQISGRLVEFIFPVDPKEAQRIADQFYSDSLTANLRAFSANLRDLKAMLHQAREVRGR